MRRALPWLLLALANPAAAFDNFDPVPGGIAGVPIGDASQPAPRALFGSSELPVLRAGEAWMALVGIPRDLAPGFYVVNAADEEDHHESHTFAVRPSTRPIYTVEAPAGTTAGELAQRHREALGKPTPAGSANEESSPDTDFILPVDEAIRFQFGLLRIQGSSYTLPFPGLGFASAKATAVVNPAFGQVIEIDGAGNDRRVVIHHGGGLVSVFRNLGAVSVSRDEWIPKGALIGNLPARSRVSLLPDWSVCLNDVEIDPLLLVSQTIELRTAAEP